ncbi:MAG: AEC family transporter [Magnetococcales bacterium]|nr:AEC family transporter [Magnetococcales bacterium]
MENFILIILLLFSGVALRRLNIFHESAALSFNQYVIYLSLPALILIQVPKLTFSTALLTPIIMPWFMMAVSVAVVLMLSRLFAWNRSITGGLLLVVPLGNTSFLGIPMIDALFGADFIPYGVLYDQLGSFPGLTIYGAIVLAVYSGNGEVSTKAIIHKIISFPPFISLLIAAIIIHQGWILPAMATSILERLADTLVPVVMVAVGLQLKFRLEKEYIKPLVAGLSLKLFFAPLLALMVCSLLGLDSDPARIAVFEAAMPSMITAGALAIAAGLAPDLMAAMVGMGLMTSYVTLPLWSYFLQSYM